MSDCYPFILIPMNINEQEKVKTQSWWKNSDCDDWHLLEFIFIFIYIYIYVQSKKKHEIIIAIRSKLFGFGTTNCFQIGFEKFVKVACTYQTIIFDKGKKQTRRTYYIWFAILVLQISIWHSMQVFFNKKSRRIHCTKNIY